MVGLSGIVGPEAGRCAVETVPPTVAGGERSRTYTDDGVHVESAFHEGTAVEQPVETADGGRLWVWGEAYSVTVDGDRRRVDPTETARVCARQYDGCGMDFVERLDGEFVGVLVDERATSLTVFTDRLGARPLYYAVTPDGVAFSTSVQTVPTPPGSDRAFNETYLAEYLYARRTFGTRTPIEGVEQAPPATVCRFDVDEAAVAEADRERYWEPRYRPLDEPPSYFARELADRLERAVADRTADGRDYGVLLSGGSDARTVLAAAEKPLTGYHLGDGWNREARIAKRSADAAGVDFELLERGVDYHETLLARAAPIQEFTGPFHTGHALGFADRIADEVDVLFTGLYSDDLFGAWSVPQLTLSLPFGVEFWPPIADLPDAVDEYVANLAASGPTREPSFLDAPPLADVLAANVDRPAADGSGAAGVDASAIDFHGVTYESVAQLALSDTLYPITNGIGFDLFSALQIRPTRNPFLDRRVVELGCRVPLKHRLRHDLVHGAMQRLDPAQAAIPHASTRLPVKYPNAAHVLGNRVMNQVDKVRGDDSYRTEGPWQDRNAVVRETDFVGRALERNEAALRRLDCVDVEAVWDTYRRHRAGETDAAEELYRLVTILEMPLTERLLDGTAPTSSAPAGDRTLPDLSGTAPRSPSGPRTVGRGD